MTDSLSSHYDIDTVSDIQPQDWDRFRTDLQALISYFELSPLFQVRPTLTNTVKFSRDSVEVSFRGVEVILCRTRGMTTVRSTFEGVEDLFIRALILIYSHHGRGRTAVFATGSNSAWDIAREVTGQATSREGLAPPELPMTKAG